MKIEVNLEAPKLPSKQQLKEAAAKAAKGAGEAANKAGKAVGAAADKTKALSAQTKDAVINAIDENGNGQIDIEDIIIKGLRVPGIRINRADFLRKELFKNYPEDVIRDAIQYNPAHAGIAKEDIDHIADEVIQYERNCVSGISTALGLAGGVAPAATISADFGQYFGYLLRATQKLLYLYGFPEIDTYEDGQQFDSETTNILVICMGVMYGAAGATTALKALAKALGAGVEKQLMRTALTKGVVYPIVKSIATKWLDTRMTKAIFSKAVGGAIPVAGGILGGGITYLSFKPCCDKLKASLQDTMLSNPDHQSTKEEDMIKDAIFKEVPLSDEELSDCLQQE